MVGIIGTVVGYGMGLYQWLMLAIISDEEYLLGSYGNYEIQQCDDPYYKAVPTPEGETPPAKTPAEVADCKQEATARVLSMRAYDAKQDIIGGLVWGTLFLVVFVTHYPHMIRREKDTHTIA